jgi:hypothetical protein
MTLWFKFHSLPRTEGLLTLLYPKMYLRPFSAPRTALKG